MKQYGAKNECAADACMLAHGPHPKRVARAALNSAKDLKYFDGLTLELNGARLFARPLGRPVSPELQVEEVNGRKGRNDRCCLKRQD